MRAHELIIESTGGGTFTVYHGTPKKFKSFAAFALGSTNGAAPINMTGFNFTDSLEVAKTFGNNILKCEVQIFRPLVINAKGANYSDFKHILNDKLSSLDKPSNRAKYDGVIIKQYADAGIYGTEYIKSNHYIPFTSGQIKILTSIDLVTETYIPDDLSEYASGYMRGMGASSHPDAIHKEDAYNWRYVPDYPISNLNPDVDKRAWMLEEIDMWADEGQPDRYHSEIHDPIEEPIIVVEIDGIGEIIDGWHRTGGSILGGRTTIPAVVGILI